MHILLLQFHLRRGNRSRGSINHICFYSPFLSFFFIPNFFPFFSFLSLPWRGLDNVALLLSLTSLDSLRRNIRNHTDSILARCVTTINSQKRFCCTRATIRCFLLGKTNHPSRCVSFLTDRERCRGKERERERGKGGEMKDKLTGSKRSWIEATVVEIDSEFLLIIRLPGCQ